MTAPAITAAELHAMFEDTELGIIDHGRAWFGVLHDDEKAWIDGDVDFRALAAAINARLTGEGAA